MNQKLYVCKVSTFACGAIPQIICLRSSLVFSIRRSSDQAGTPESGAAERLIFTFATMVLVPLILFPREICFTEAEEKN